MANEKDVNNSAAGATSPESHDEGVLTNAARVIGGALGKVSTKLHIVKAPSRKPASKANPRKKSTAKKAATKKTATKRPAPTTTKNTVKKTPRAAKPAPRSSK